MSIERGRQHEVKGLHELPNVEADQLETHLGIKFLHKPAKIPLTLKNRFALLRSNPLLLASHTEMFKNSAEAARYLSGMNAYVYWPDNEDKDSLVALHENMHGYTREQSPLIGDTIGMFQDASTVRKIRERGDPAEVERLVAISCFNEGISQWGSIETYGRIKLEQEIKQHSQTLPEEEIREVMGTFHTAVIFGDSVEPDAMGDKKPEVDTLLAQLQEASHALTMVVQTKSLTELATVVAKAALFLRLMRDTQYRLGHYFVYEGMNTLRNSGMTTEDSLKLLIQNAPQECIQLGEPITYAQELRATS